MPQLLAVHFQSSRRRGVGVNRLGLIACVRFMVGRIDDGRPTHHPLWEYSNTWTSSESALTTIRNRLHLPACLAQCRRCSDKGLPRHAAHTALRQKQNTVASPT